MRRRGRIHRVGGHLAPLDLAGAVPQAIDAAHDEAARDLMQRLLGPQGAAFERGDLLVAPAGFGVGVRSDRAALGLARAGVGGVISPALGPAFRESCHHAGVATIEVADVDAFAGAGDDVIVDFASGTVENVTRHRVMVADALPRRQVERVRTAPGLAWYGVGGPADPDVAEWHRGGAGRGRATPGASSMGRTP